MVQLMVDFALPSWYDSLKDLTVKRYLFWSYWLCEGEPALCAYMGLLVGVVCSLFLDLPDDFVEYLSSDGCTLPAGLVL